jgi:hypothetical protein
MARRERDGVVFNHPLVIQIACLRVVGLVGANTSYQAHSLTSMPSPLKKWAVPDLDGFKLRESRVLLRLYMYV